MNEWALHIFLLRFAYKKFINKERSLASKAHTKNDTLDWQRPNAPKLSRYEQETTCKIGICTLTSPMHQRYHGTNKRTWHCNTRAIGIILTKR